MSEDRSLERIAALLAQAEGTDNEAEAAAFMEAAQRLATLRGVDLARARSHTKAKESTKPEQRTVLIGKAGTRGLRTLVDLYLGIARANDVKVTIAHNATRVYAHGYAEDIDMAERLYTSLVIQMVTASQAFIKSGAHKQDTVQQRVKVKTDRLDWNGRPMYDFQWQRRPVSALTARLEFQSAFSKRIESRLAATKMQAEAEAIKENDLADSTLGEDAEGATGTALVLADKRDEVEKFYKHVNPRLRGSYRGHTSGAFSASSRNAGRSAADNARLSGSQALPGARKGLAS